MRRSPRILEDLSYISSSAASAALLLLSGCATGGGQVQADVSSLRAEVRTLQRENADLMKRVESMATQIDVLAARAARANGPVPAPSVSAIPGAAAEKPANPAVAAPATVAALEGALVVPGHLKVIRLEPTSKVPPKAGKTPSQASPPPAVPTATPIQEPSAEALAALGGKPPTTDAQAAFERARAQTGLVRARSFEQFADAYPSSARAGEALVDAARTRMEAGDPDGSCEDFSRVVAEHPASRAMPDALEGQAACELRRGRPAEATRLQTRLAKDFPDSPAGKRAREHAPSVQGAAP
jgi:TolA-binding protein